ncbi:MAG TPA: caspase family protein [Anaeromyxobacter sp.]|nr:caspase family protein [Anaeromyxobacter sp.]
MSAARTLAIAIAVLAGGTAAASERRFALLAGEPDGGGGTVRLRYAERDARRMHEILTRVGGVRPEDARLLLSAGAGAFRRALDDLAAASAAARARGERTVLVVYYSGHAKDGALRLGGGRLPLDELRAALERAPADVRIGLLDSCRSGAIARTKGARPAPSFDVKTGEEGPSGLVLIASSAAGEDSQESDAVGASWFTHHLASGLLGAADASGDARVTLAEAYAYAYARTVGSTASSEGGVQHPVFLYALGGAGDVVLADLAPVSGGIALPAHAEGLYVILDRSGRAVAEVAKAGGSERRVALPAGRYQVKKRLPDESGLLVARLDVDRVTVPLDDARMDRVPLDRDPQKGWRGKRVSLLAGAGAQRFFSEAARDGLFPPATLLGAELSIRDDLGHGIAWGLDFALGGGRGEVRIPDAPPIPVEFGEIAGGASLWKDWRLGALTLSAGGRVAVTWLGRSFPPAENLPPQYFFTVTPGLTGSAAWRFTRRVSAVARVRASYLFYNVDENRSLGFAEALVGVEYALVD